VSEDQIVGNEQKAEVFWQRVATKYKELVPNTERKETAIRTHWATISASVRRFVGILKQVFDLDESGTTVEDQKAKALITYNTVHGESFDMFMPAYEVLKDCPMFNTEGLNKRKEPGDAAGEDGAAAVAVAVAEGEGSAPVGVKKAKKAVEEQKRQAAQLDVLKSIGESQVARTKHEAEASTWR